MRIANATVARNYTRNLGRSMVRLNDFGHKAETWRKFSSMAEDTSGGVRAMELRRNIARLHTNVDNASTSLSVIKEAETQLRYAHDITKQFHERILQAINGDKAPDDRAIIAQELTRLREEMVTVANARFSDRYLFGGTIIDSLPFNYGSKENPSMDALTLAIDSFDTALTATPITPPDDAAVMTAFTDLQTAFAALSEPINKADLNTAVVALDTAVASISDPAENSLYDALLTEVKTRITNLTDTPKLLYHGEDVNTTLNPGSVGYDANITSLLTRSSYIDIGLGVKLDSNIDVDPKTVFKNSFDGLEIFGVGDDNIILMMDNIIASITDDTVSPSYIGAQLDTFLGLAGKLNIQVTAIGADTNYLEFTIDRMKLQEINLEERRKEVEAIDPAKAIMDYELQHTAYSAALQMGQRVLMPTLWDYVR